MIFNYNKADIPDLVIRQLLSFFPLSDDEKTMIIEAIPAALNRVERCISQVDNKYFHRDGDCFFNPFHSGQWLIFLYYLSNTLSTSATALKNVKIGGGNKSLADKIYYLNKIMHSVDIYHEVELPNTFFLEHPIGTVLGRAQYQDGFMAYQNCTVGGNKGYYPKLGANFKMMSGSKVLGNSNIGDNVTLAANTYVKDTDIPSGATVFGSSPNLTIKYL